MSPAVVKANRWRAFRLPVRVTPVNSSGVRVGPTVITDQHVTVHDGWVLTWYLVVVRAGLTLSVDPHQKLYALRFRHASTGLDHTQNLAAPGEYTTFALSEDCAFTGRYWRWRR